ncbi:unnamed protein product [Onchocerca flexuosa]|uniref:Ovule protein n=1 Tax=Onchocerca flexuosa TaxID=387005 RepID=A0A183HLZ7_9BILA|nr:unnamed protein product [Onchocerca flexuosa]
MSHIHIHVIYKYFPTIALHLSICKRGVTNDDVCSYFILYGTRGQQVFMLHLFTSKLSSLQLVDDVFTTLLRCIHLAQNSFFYGSLLMSLFPTNRSIPPAEPQFPAFFTSISCHVQSPLLPCTVLYN